MWGQQSQAQLNTQRQSRSTNTLSSQRPLPSIRMSCSFSMSVKASLQGAPSIKPAARAVLPQGAARPIPNAPNAGPEPRPLARGGQARPGAAWPGDTRGDSGACKRLC